MRRLYRLLWVALSFLAMPLWAGDMQDVSATSDHEAKVSGAVRFTGSVGHVISNTQKTTRLYFDELVNQSTSGTSGALEVRLFLTTDPITYGQSFTSKTVAVWAPPSVLQPDYRYLNVDVTVPTLPVGDGVYYIHLGVFEAGNNARCTFTWCYSDFRTFSKRVQVNSGNFSEYLGPAIQPGAEALAVEYFHGGMGHYFLTSIPGEISVLDGNAQWGWTRTGQTFKVWSNGIGLADVCRFFTDDFAPKSSHFYSSSTAECQLLMSSAVWQYEGTAFRVANLVGGVCPVGVPMYRLYNNGQTGAPNHRYTTSAQLRDQMIAQGFVLEGIAFCVASGTSTPPPPPPGPTRSSAEGLWIGQTGTSRDLWGVILNDGQYYVLYGPQGGANTIAGIVVGTGSSSNGLFTSSFGRDFNFETGAILTGSVSAQYTPMSTLAGTVTGSAGSTTFSASYSALYDQPFNLTQVAGTYAGSVILAAGLQSATFTLAANGQITGSGQGCNFYGTATPRGSVGVANLSVTFGGGLCYFGTATLVGIATYEPSSGNLYVVIHNAGKTDGALFVGKR